jgi:hypothetical protein
MAFKSEEELQAYVEWTKREIQGMAEHIRNSDLFQEEVVGHAVWTLPHQLFIGKAWPKSNRDKGYWIISGSDLPADHIELAVAETARDAARHFCMKWQLQSARLMELGAGDAEPGSGDEVDWQKLAAGLEAQAEGLYGLVESEDLWETTEGPLVRPEAGDVT